MLSVRLVSLTYFNIRFFLYKTGLIIPALMQGTFHGLS